MNPCLRATAALLLLQAACTAAPDRSADAGELLRLHEEVLEAHRTGDVDRWMAVEGDSVVSANDGTISFPPADRRRSIRTGYLSSTTFTTYRDLRAPIVRVSSDGTLGWVIAEVEVAGTRARAGADPVPVHDVWAWIELYERGPEGWRMIGNVSNRRPPGTP